MLLEKKSLRLLSAFLFVISLSIVLSACGKDVGSQSFASTKIERAQDGNLTISWEKSDSDKVEVYWGTTPDRTTKDKKLIATIDSGNSAIFKDLNPDMRSYFVLKASNGGSKVVAERLLPLQGTTNFRDLGGYQTGDGRTVKWGQFFRSDELAGLKESDIKYLTNSGLKLVCDYRTAQEKKDKPDPQLASVKRLELDIAGSKSSGTSQNGLAINDLFKTGSLKSLGKPGEMLTQGNADMVESDLFKQMIQLLDSKENLPFLQHCTAGKDRTGFGSAIILLTLGVPEETVIKDYLLSNTYRAANNEKMLQAVKPSLKDDESIETFKSILEVRRECLVAAFGKMKKDYGSIDGYLEKKLGLTNEKRKQLQDKFLER